MSGLRRRQAAEAGQTSLLIIGFVTVIAMMVAVVVDASAAYLRRQGLDSLADGAALAAVDGVQGEQVYVGGLGSRAEIDPQVASKYVAAYLRTLDARSTYPELSYSVVTGIDSVTVRVSAPLDLPLRPPGWESTPMITGTAAAYVDVSG